MHPLKKFFLTKIDDNCEEENQDKVNNLQKSNTKQ